MVYFVQAANDPEGLIKIGKCTDLKKRLSALQTGSPVILKVLAVLRYELKDIPFHDKFASARQHGEWFRPTSDLMQFIASIRDTPLSRREHDAELAAAFTRLTEYEAAKTGRKPSQRKETPSQRKETETHISRLRRIMSPRPLSVENRKQLADNIRRRTPYLVEYLRLDALSS